MADRGIEWRRWVDALPKLLDARLQTWDLRIDGTAGNGFCSIVIPVRTREHCPAMLKIAYPDEESEHEHLALRRWDGGGAVRLLRADPHQRALLLERLHPENLRGLWDIEACEIVAGLYGRIHVAAPPKLRLLTGHIARANADLATLPRNAALPHRLIEQALTLGADLISDPASVGTLIHGDLHYDNVLAGDREPWLVIDPKPMSGDPHYELAPMLWNRWAELDGYVRDGVRQRFHTLVDAAGLDVDRARAWVIVRMMHNALWELTADHAVPDPEWLTTCVAVAKAVQD